MRIVGFRADLHRRTCFAGSHPIRWIVRWASSLILVTLHGLLGGAVAARMLELLAFGCADFALLLDVDQGAEHDFRQR